MRLLALVAVLPLAAALSACASEPDPAAAAASARQAPADGQHEGITTPHGDHSPQHGGLVLMDKDLHFEVVFDRQGRHRVWFTDAVRFELPASLASHVTMEVRRPGEPPEPLQLAIDEFGESWIASGRPVEGDDVMVMVRYSVQGEPYEIELPFLTSVPAGGS